MSDGIVEVMQADREAAASVHASRHLAACIIDGEMDGNNVVQAFARHRLAATPAEPDEVTSERQAIVRWLLEQSDIGADHGLAADKGTTRRAAYGGGSLALKRASEEIAVGGHLRAARPAASRSGGA